MTGRAIWWIQQAARRSTAALMGLGFALALSACGGGGALTAASVLPTPAAPTPPSVPVSTPAVSATWVVMGSSTAFGAGASAGNGWVEQVRRAYAAQLVTVVNLAKGGSVTYQGLASGTTPPVGRPAPDVLANIDSALARQPKVLVLAYPTNDTALGYTVDETVSNLLAIRAIALASGINVLVMSTQPRNLSATLIARLETLDDRMSATVGGCFVPVRSALAGPDGKLAPVYDSGDGVHPSDAGHTLIADRARAVVDSGACFAAGSR